MLLGKPTARLDLGLELVVLFHRPVPRVEQLRQHLGNLTSEPRASRTCWRPSCFAG